VIETSGLLDRRFTGAEAVDAGTPGILPAGEGVQGRSCSAAVSSSRVPSRHERMRTGVFETVRLKGLFSK